MTVCLNMFLIQMYLDIPCKILLYKLRGQISTDEAKEGRDAFKEKRAPDFTQYPKFP